MPQFDGQVTRWLSVRRLSRNARVLYCITGLLALLVVASGCAGLNDNGTDLDTVATLEAREQAGAPTGASPTGGSPVGSPLALPEGDPAVGQQVYQASCASCHSIDGSVILGPTWQGLYGSQVELENGETVEADDAYIVESIRNPAAKIHAGFPNAMPPFPNLTDEEIAGVIAYIQTLE